MPNKSDKTCNIPMQDLIRIRRYQPFLAKNIFTIKTGGKYK